MSEPLLCPSCRKSTMYWLDSDAEDLLENGIMECKSCKAQYIGIPGWHEATMNRGEVNESN